MISLVIFDMGGVLIENPSSKMFDYYCHVLGTNKDDFICAFLDVKDPWQAGLIKEDEFWNKMCARLNVPVPREPLWLRGFELAYCERERVLNIVESLKQDGLIIGILSNIEKPLVEFVTKRFESYAQHLVYSCETHRLKPKKEAYLECLSRFGIPSEQAIMVDDREENVLAAEGIGMRGIVYHSPKQLEFELKAVLI